MALLAQWRWCGGRFGRSMVAMRENEERSRMLGYNPFTIKLAALTLSGLYAGWRERPNGFAVRLCRRRFGTTQYTILPMLYVLLGGRALPWGRFWGAGLMAWLIDLASSLTEASLAIIGAVLIALVVFAPKGILGTIRERARNGCRDLAGHWPQPSLWRLARGAKRGPEPYHGRGACLDRPEWCGKTTLSACYPGG